jgi:hypothetical protein
MDANEIVNGVINSEAEDHEKAAGSVMTAGKLHGSNGLFSTPGMERDILTTLIRPYGIGGTLPLIPSTTEDPRFGSITGVAQYAGAEPTNACDDAPAGYMTGATLTAKFGMVRRDTNVIDIAKTLMKVNRGDMTDLVLRGRMLGETGLAPSEVSDENVLNILTKSEMLIAGINAERKLSNDMWQGTVAAKTFPGLDVQIATGQKDADSGVAVPALDSDIRDFALDKIGGTGRDIVEFLSSMMWSLEYNASQMGLDPVSHVIVMNAGLWFELTAVWPIAYNTNRGVTLPTGNTVMLDGRDNVTERDAMRKGMYIDINGKRYPVILDTGIVEKNSTTAGIAAGSFASSIYILPLTVNGSFPVLYREYLDFRATQRESALLRGNEMFWSDAGVYSWVVEQNKWCYKLALRTEQRIVLRTPHLAGKIMNIKYTPMAHLRDVNPGSPYFVAGGVSIRNFTPGQAVGW